MTSRFNNIFRVCSIEFRNIMRDHGVVLFVFFVPLLYPLLYAFIYTNETVRDVPVAVVNDSGSALSRQFVRMLDATPEVRVVASCTDVAEAEHLNRLGEIYAFVVIPADFDRTLDQGRQAVIGVYADMAGMLYYKSALLAATNVSLALNKELKVERFYTGATPRQEAIATQPVDYDYVALYNPQSGFASFLMPAVMMLIIQQTLMLGIGMVGGGIRERFNGRALPPMRAFGNPLAVTFGKTIVYFAIYIIIAAYMFTVVNYLFGLPARGRFVTYIAFIVPYILACIFMGITFSSFLYRREDCIVLFVFMSVPLLFISGISWPGAAIPRFWQWVGMLFPSTYAVNGYVRINSMGASLGQVAHEFTALWIQTGAYLLLAILFYHLAIRRNSLRR
ncbi:MAG: ABC transporter permease [Bacteroides sp.]|nr:ABC transporter permease [Bacteroidales bacterium]MBD5326684.1 ABC transporter permease [Bacteroides sp.]MBD5328185.1 ABC transporter permease [Bacteroides sp.]